MDFKNIAKVKIIENISIQINDGFYALQYPIFIIWKILKIWFLNLVYKNYVI